jgi:hypothetical protein
LRRLGWLSISRPTHLQFEHDLGGGEKRARRIIRRLNGRTS